MCIERVAGIFIAAVFCASVLPFPAAAETSILRCQEKDAVDLQEDGTLERTAAAKAQMVDHLLIDLSTGVVRLLYGSSSSGPIHYTVVQEGSSANDTVLVKLSGASEIETLAKGSLVSAATEFIRVRQWSIVTGKEPAIHFLRYSLSTLFSGTCQPLG